MVEKRSPHRDGLPQILSALTRALGSDAIVGVVDGPGRDESYQVEVRVGRRKHRLFTHWVGQGWPERTHELVLKQRRPWPGNHVVVAHRFSPVTQAMLKRLGANWMDQTGAARIVTPSGMLVVTDGSDVTLETRKRSTHWTSATADVAEILIGRGDVLPIREISAATGWRSPAVGRGLLFLDSMGWTKKAGPSRGVGAHRILLNREGLLESWAEFVAIEPRIELQAHALMRDPLQYLEKDLAPALAALGKYAVSGWAGLELVAPFVTSVPAIHVYVDASVFDSQLRSVLTRLKAREVTEGARLIFWRGRPAVFANANTSSSKRTVSTAHPSRLYADLLTLGDRGRDAAEHVRLELLSSSKNHNVRQRGGA